MNVRRAAKMLAGGLAAFVLLAAALAARPCYHLFRCALLDNELPSATPKGFVNDASRLNETRAETWEIPADPAAREKQLAELLAKARAEKRRVSIGGARHSMGGHSIYPGGVTIDMRPHNGMELEAEAKILRVQAGALWKDIIPFLDRQGLSVGVMQSNDSFSVGGSISVNCHGWQYGRPPIASTVESFRLMRADGRVYRCSRTENKELFSLVLGGYGLFGIILDVDLRVVPNERYRMTHYVVPVDQSLNTFQSKIAKQPGVQMFYARLNVQPERLLQDVIMDVYVKEEGPLPVLKPKGLARLRRAIFRGSALNDYGKKLRYNAETRLQPYLTGTVFSRNQLLSESVEVFQNRTAGTTDILQEYFVPRANVLDFVGDMRGIIREEKPNLLNVTVRLVEEDQDAFMRYADRPVVAFVMLFVQDKTEKGEEEMARLTRRLIDAALKNGGRYYLPYRLHATKDQFSKAYPQAAEFFSRKRHYDPDELFQNYFYLEYGKP